MKRDPDCTCLLNQLGNIKVTDPWCKVHGDGILKIQQLEYEVQKRIEQRKQKGWS